MSIDAVEISLINVVYGSAVFEHIPVCIYGAVAKSIPYLIVGMFPVGTFQKV